VNPSSTTPIKHVVVIFQENVSFDHYFGTYPHAANTDGQPFKAAEEHAGGRRAAPGDRDPNRSRQACSTHGPLIASNPNSAPPVRLDSSPTGLAWNIGGQLTCDQDHNYSDEQQSFDNGNMDQFVQSVGRATATRRSARRARRPP
jgi:phospholipase C